jgi:hypothetical protein
MRKLQQHTSAAASISACHAFLPCPNIVAAINLYLHFPLTSSAAFKNIAARSAQGIASHSALAARAPSMACAMCSGVASEKVQIDLAWSCGIGWRDVLDDFTYK